MDFWINWEGMNWQEKEQRDDGMQTQTTKSIPLGQKETALDQFTLWSSWQLSDMFDYCSQPTGEKAEAQII